MQSLEHYKFDRIKKSAQFILIDNNGGLIDSCNSIFDTSNKSQEIKEWMPLMESIISQVLLLELDSPELFLPKIQAPMKELRGFYDFSFIKTELKGQELILWIIYDNTKIYKDFFSYQQNRNELVLKNQRIGVIQSVLQSKRQELNSQIKRLNHFGKVKQTYYELISSNGQYESSNGNGHRNRALNGETSSYISEIETTIGSLQDLVEELVILTNVKDISKFENKEFQICSLLNQIAQNFVGENSVDFDINVHSDIPEQLIGNYIYLKQIIISLMKESLKLNETGVISIDLQPAIIEGSNNCFIVEFKFAATGEITNHPTISNYTGNDIKQNNLLDYGSELELKLSIIQKFAASHNGSFKCESNEDCDLLVAFSFPYENIK